MFKLEFDILTKRFNSTEPLRESTNFSGDIQDHDVRSDTKRCCLRSFSLRISGDLHSFVAIAEGKKLVIITVDDDGAFHKCARVELTDFVKEIVFDSKHRVLSVLYERNGVDILRMRFDAENKGNEKWMEIENVLRSWNGTKEVSMHRILECSEDTESGELTVSVLMVCGEGNVLMIANESGKVRNRFLLQCDKVMGGRSGEPMDDCLVDIVSCRLLYDRADEMLIGVGSSGIVYDLNPR